jgi:hypothetical protein
MTARRPSARHRLLRTVRREAQITVREVRGIPNLRGVHAIRVDQAVTNIFQKLNGTRENLPQIKNTLAREIFLGVVTDPRGLFPRDPEKGVVAHAAQLDPLTAGVRLIPVLEIKIRHIADFPILPLVECHATSCWRGNALSDASFAVINLIALRSALKARGVDGPLPPVVDTLPARKSVSRFPHWRTPTFPAGRGM